MSVTTEEQAFAIEVDGQAIPARPGQTVAAALMAAGRRTFRLSHASGSPRGIFCGMGVCFECLVLIDGVSEMRACITPARPGMHISLRTGQEASGGDH